MRSEITAYYERLAEPGRLGATPWGKLEYLRTWDVLMRELPAPPAQILDVGGAAGVYAAPLGGMGYDVHLIDPLDEHVAMASILVRTTATLGDARDLPVPDASADAVLMLGPLYHLTERADRVKAWQEAARVSKPGAVIVAATISRYASMLDGFVKGYLREPAFGEMLERPLAEGVHENLGGGKPEWFTTAYFHLPNEAAEEAADAGLAVKRVVSVEGPLWMLADRLDSWITGEDETEETTLLTWLRRVEEEPGLLGSSSHLLTICRNPG